MSAQTPKHLHIGLVYDDSLDQFSGVTQYCVTLGRHLARKGHEVELLVGETRSHDIAGLPIRSLARNLSVRFNGNRLSIPFSARGSELRNILAHGRFDVLHVQMPYSPLMAGRLISYASAETAIWALFMLSATASCREWEGAC